MIKSKKNNNNITFIFTLCLMVSLIMLLLVPTAMAWFTDNKTGNNSTTIKFGTVNIDAIIAENSFLTAERDVNNVLPGDKLNFNISAKNTGTVSEYAMVGTYIRFLYEETDGSKTDITGYLQPHISEIGTLTPDTSKVIVGTDYLFELSASEELALTGFVIFDGSLPNAVGDFEEFVLNGSSGENARVSIELNVVAAAIQKDNVQDVETAETKVKELIYGPNMAVEGATVSTVSLESFAYLKSFLNINYDESTLLTVNDVEKSGDISNVVIDVSNLNVNVGDNVTVLHYDENNKNWETVGVYSVNNNLTITVTDFTSLSPVALILEAPILTYTVEGSGTSAQLKANGNSIECEAAWDISATSSDNVVAYLTQEESKQILTIAGSGNMKTYTNGSQPYVEYKTTLTHLIVKNGVKNISNQAFREFEALNSVKLGNAVELIDIGAFIYCSNLSNFTFNKTLKEVGLQAFAVSGIKKVEFPNSVQTVGNQVFQQCTSLESIKFYNPNTTIGDACLLNCTSLKEVYLPKNLIKISDGTFQNCTSLKTLELPESIETIGQQAFNLCSNLEIDVNLPNAKTFKRKAFFGTKVKNVNCPKLETLDTWAFSESTVITVRFDILENIQEGAFDSCSQLTSIYMPKVKYIGAQVFEYCTKLTIDLPEGLLWIGDFSFNHCSSSQQTQIVIPSTLVQIGGTSYVGNNTDNNIIPTHVFYNCATAKLKEFIVADGNTNFVTHEGVLYSKNYKVLISYPSAKTATRYEMPEGCTNIAELGFSRAHFLKTLVIANSFIVKPSIPDNFINLKMVNSLIVGLYVYNSISSFEIKEGNTRYAVDNGILYSADFTELIAVPTAHSLNSTIKIHENVTTIGMMCFAHSDSTPTYNGQKVGGIPKGIEIGANVATIADDALFWINYYGWTIVCNSPHFKVVNDKLEKA